MPPPTASKIFKIIILGAPASGKGTISSRIIRNFNLEHVSSGDRLRLNIRNGTPIGLEAQKYMKKGHLVPDELMIKFITNELEKVKSGSWLLDGFPRTLPQAEKFWDVCNVDLALNLDVPFDVIVDRVKGRWVHLPSGRVYNVDFNAPKIAGKDDITGEDLIQREDDNPKIVRKRLEQYETLTRPVIEFYRKKRILEEFQGRTSDEIWPMVLGCLSSYIPIHIRSFNL